MDAMTTDPIRWTYIDPEGLPRKQAAAWDAYQDAYEAANKKKKVFENLMQEQAPEGKTLRVSTKFGKLALALTPKQSARQARKQPPNLADCLAEAEEEH